MTAEPTFAFDNSYLWRLRHVKSHHVFPNVNDCDIDIDEYWWIRLSPNQPHLPHHRFQHLYAPLIFWLVNIHTTFYQDAVYLFKHLLTSTWANKPGPGRPRSIGRDGNAACVIRSQHEQAMRGRTIRFTTKRPGTYSSSSVTSSPSRLSLPPQEAQASPTSRTVSLRGR